MILVGEVERGQSSGGRRVIGGELCVWTRESERSEGIDARLWLMEVDIFICFIEFVFFFFSLN